MSGAPVTECDRCARFSMKGPQSQMSPVNLYCAAGGEEVKTCLRVVTSTDLLYTILDQICFSQTFCNLKYLNKPKVCTNKPV